MGRERQGEKGGKAATRNGVEREIYRIGGGMGDKRERRSSGENEVRGGEKKQGNAEKGGESLQYFNHSFSQITEQPRTDSGSPLLSSPFISLATPLLSLLIVQISLTD